MDARYNAPLDLSRIEFMKPARFQPFWKLSIVSLFILSLPGTLTAHPFHLSLAEAEFNPQSKHLEVALKVYPPDLLRALKARVSGGALPKEKVSEVTTNYLKEVFRVQLANGKSSSLDWVGMEENLKATWLYFQFPLPDGLNGVKIENRIFFEFESRQINTINLKKNGRWESLRFSPKPSDSKFARRELSPRESLQRVGEVLRSSWTTLNRDLRFGQQFWVHGSLPEKAKPEPTQGDLKSETQRLLRSIAQVSLRDKPPPSPKESQIAANLQITTISLLEGKHEEAQSRLLKSLILLKKTPSSVLEEIALELTSRLSLRAENPKPAYVFLLSLKDTQSVPQLSEAIYNKVSKRERQKVRTATQTMTLKDRLDYARSYLVNLEWDS